MTETDITRMASDYADNELELFRKTVGLFTAKNNIYVYIENTSMKASENHHREFIITHLSDSDNKLSSNGKKI